MALLTLGNFSVDLLDMLGQGGFGVVYSGKNTRTSKKVAIKKIQFESEDDGYASMQEIKHFERLPKHKNLIRLLDFFYKDRAFWMVMDFCDSGDLDKYMKVKSLEIGEKIRLMFQCASAIAHMHGATPPMIHRDIKPANILMFKDSNGETIVKLSDFGLSKLANNSAATAIFNTKAGTPGFLAPEIFQQKPYSFPVDIFALGLVFLAMIQHKAGDPFLMPRVEGKEDMLQIGEEMSRADQDGRRQPTLCTVKDSDKPELGKLKRVVLRMTAYKPNDRYKASDVVKNVGTITGLWKPPLDKPTTSLCQMTANPDGTYTLKIKPEIAGKLTVAFHDRHVPGSPFELKVRQAPDSGIGFS